MKTVSVLKYTFTAIGLAMLIGTFLLYSNTRDFLKTAITTDGTVVALVPSRSSNSVTYAPVIQFQDKTGRLVEFMSSSSSNPPSYDEGEKVEVFYQASAPESARINGFFSLWGLPTILGGLGILFFLVGFSIIVFGRLKNRKAESLRKYGMPVKAKIKSVYIDRAFTVNGRNPYKISAEWQCPQSAEIHVFNSDNIWFDPTDRIVDEEVTVLIEKENPKKYHVDISSLPETAG
ncbi:DUF3592 domain-containing protein [Microbulbifer taiwanensis]|uniref:DUF3592 domain-containing protein n=2 Tax=Microbulbifer taiwanensis TaxID=986746 RepID=A0ABW1YKU7_9GAMM|nr:DUF3592 domain-containing protein [Microbulbifer taiwanensis]